MFHGFSTCQICRGYTKRGVVSVVPLPPGDDEFSQVIFHRLLEKANKHTYNCGHLPLSIHIDPFFTNIIDLVFCSCSIRFTIFFGHIFTLTKDWPYPLVIQHSYGKSLCLIDKSTISMVIFHSFFDITRWCIPSNPQKNAIFLWFSYAFPGGSPSSYQKSLAGNWKPTRPTISSQPRW